MTSPWKKLENVEGPVDFLDITSEQLAKSLQERDLNQLVDSIQINNENQMIEENELCSTIDSDVANNDEIIAYFLQSEFNEEYNLMLKRTEDKINRNSRVNISYSNYRTPVSQDEQLQNIENVDDEKKDFDRFVSIEKEYASIPRCGYKKIGQGSKIVTKHDTLMSSRINACRVLQFPPGICTGDTGGFDVKLNNNVFNSLRAHSHAQCSRNKEKQRCHIPHK